MSAFNRHSTTLLCGVILVGLITVLHYGSSALIKRGETYAGAWIKSLGSSLPDNDNIAFHARFNQEAPETRRLLQQLQQIRGKVTFHAEITTFFYARYFMAISAAALSGLLAGALVITILRVGWQNASPYAKVAFLVSAGATAYFAAFPGMFRQAENISDNAALFVAYANLENDIHTFLATGLAADGKPVELPAYIQVVNSRMAELNRIAIGFDATKLPVADAAFGVVSDQR